MAKRKNASKKKQDHDGGGTSSGEKEQYSSPTVERKEEQDEEEDDNDSEYIVEIDDPVKVKQAIDEAIIKAVGSSGIKEDHFWCNIKFYLEPPPAQTLPCLESGIPALVLRTSFDALSETFTLWVCDSTSIPQAIISIPLIYPYVDSGYRHTKKELKVGNFFDYEGHFDEVGIEELTIATVRSHISKYKKKGT